MDNTPPSNERIPATRNATLGRPKGSPTKAPVVSLTTIRRAVDGVAKRARAGSPEDQRIVAQLYAASPVTGGLLSGRANLRETLGHDPFLEHVR